jgi:hypothetical protein
MSLRGQIFIVMASLMLVAFVLDALKRKRINEEYCLWWIGIMIATDILVVDQPLLLRITHCVGALLPISTLTLFAFICTCAILIYFSMKISMLTNQMKEMIQVVALQNKVIGDLRSKNTD